MYHEELKKLRQKKLDFFSNFFTQTMILANCGLFFLVCTLPKDDSMSVINRFQVKMSQKTTLRKVCKDVYQKSLNFFSGCNDIPTYRTGFKTVLDIRRFFSHILTRFPLQQHRKYTKTCVFQRKTLWPTEKFGRKKIFQKFSFFFSTYI